MAERHLETAADLDEGRLRVASEAAAGAVGRGEASAEPEPADPAALRPELELAGAEGTRDLQPGGAFGQQTVLEREAEIDPRTGPLADLAADLANRAALTDVLGADLGTTTDVAKVTGFDSGLSVDRVGLNLDPLAEAQADMVAQAVGRHGRGQVSGGGGDSTSPAEEKGVLETIVDVVTDVVKAAFDLTPEPVSTLAPLASEEGAAAEQGVFNLLQEKDAKDSSDLGTEEGNEEYYRLREQSTADFYKSKTQPDGSTSTSSGSDADNAEDTVTAADDPDGSTSTSSGSDAAKQPVNPDWGGGETSPGSPGDLIVEPPSVTDPPPDETSSTVVVDLRGGIPVVEAAPYDPNPLDRYASVVEGPPRQENQVYDPAPDQVDDATSTSETITVHSGGPGIVGSPGGGGAGPGGAAYETTQSAMMREDPDDEPPPEPGSVAGGGSSGGEWGDLGSAASSVAAAAASAGAAVETAGQWVDDQARAAGDAIKDATGVLLDGAESAAHSAARAAGGVLASDWAERAIAGARDSVEGAVDTAIDSVVNAVDDTTDVAEAAGAAAQGDWAAAGEKALDASGVLTGGFVDVEQDDGGTHVSVAIPASSPVGPSPSVGGGGDLDVDVGGSGVSAELTSTTPVGSGSITTTSDVGLTVTDEGLEASAAVAATSSGLANTVAGSGGSEVLPTALGASADVAVGAGGVDLIGTAWSESDGLLLAGSSTASAQVHLGTDGIAISGREDTSGRAGALSFSDSTGAGVSLDSSGLAASFERSHELAAFGMTDGWSASADVQVDVSGVDVAVDAEYVHVDPALGAFGVSAGSSGIEVDQPLGPGLADAQVTVLDDDPGETQGSDADGDPEPVP